MPTCAAINCSRKDTKAEREKGFTFHRFPHSHAERLRQWIIKIRRENFTPSTSAVLCSAHFEDKCFYRMGQRTQLLEDAVPTKFDFPAHLQKPVKSPRKAPKKRKLVHPHPDLTDCSLPETCERQLVSSTSDHNYAVSVVSPRKLKRRLDDCMEKYLHLQKKLKISHQKTRRLNKKVASLKEVVDILRKKNLVSNGCADVLAKFSGGSRQLLERALNDKSANNAAYHPELRAFAVTLQFYSTKAYNFVRKTFNLALPHPSVIRRWYSSVPGSPGFTQSAFSALQLKVQEAEKHDRNVLCALMLDEMSIKKHVQWDGKQFHGYVAVGNDDYDDSTPIAKDALVIMAVAVNDSWKVPCGYFFIDGLTGKERANLIKVCIQRLHDVGVWVISLTCDGPSCHFSMLKELGANLESANMQPYFKHPCDPTKRVFIMLDSCHMLKLVRNTLGDMQTLIDKDGHMIHWKHLVALNELQESEGFHLANKLSSTHIQWKKQKMKVNLAAQTLSNSVADAIEFCSKKLNLPSFLDSEGTVKFIRMFDRLFDILNSRHPLARGLKAPLRAVNEHVWKSFLEEAEEYILGLKDQNGTPIVQSRRKTAFIGFLACLKSVKGIFASYVACDEPPLKYLLTYKLSQDHLELFFCAIRACGRANNNPTAAFKRLLMRHNIEANGGNCTVLDGTRILEGLPHDVTDTVQLPSTTLSDITIARKYDLNLTASTETDDLEGIPDIVTSTNSEYRSAAVSYMAGFVCRMVDKKLSCNRCLDFLCAADGRCHEFISFKDKGGLKKPSHDVVVICKETDRCIKNILRVTNNKLPQGPGIPSAIATAVLSAVHDRVFADLSEHRLDTAVEEDHVIILIKTISICYIKIVFHHLAKKKTEKITGPKIRKEISKLVLFKHQ